MKKKRLFDLQLFAEDGTGEAQGSPEAAQVEEKEKPATDPKATPKYTDEDLDKIISRKIAEERKRQEKAVTEAERLSKMSAEEKANERIKAMEDKLRDYELRESRAEMTKEARAILADKNIHVDDALLANLIAEDADNTKAAVESFVKLFQAAVDKAVREKVKGETPKTGTSTGITKEQIMAVTNRAERQRLMAEHKDLF